MLGSTVSHDRILYKLVKFRRWKYLSCPGCGCLQQASIRTLPDVIDLDTEQFRQFKHHAEFWKV